ncbi:MAG: hypothetical protein EPO07_16410 [Verrucomicrobia bacterium]|nr:MAG: hypothetical protein EPO07_16410 [Verrucomicrobiota bacterium]
MSTVDKIKVAVLKRKLAAGVNDLDHGSFQTYSDANLMQLADDVGRTGRIRLNGLHLKVAAKVQKKGNL